MPKYRILCLDGGGLRGLVTAVVLQRLNAAAGLAGWLDKVDLIAGTSTGGILALAIAKGLPPEAIRTLYETKGKKIFDDSWLDNLVDLGQVMGAEYDNRNLEKELKKVLGVGTTLGDLPRRVLIPTFDLDNEADDAAARSWKPKVFHNLPTPDSDAAVPAYKAALYTSAAPTYFPSVDGFVDGGVYANNPSMCALAQAQDSRLPQCPRLADIVLLSLGTGTSLVHVKGKELDWGFAQWAKPLIGLMMDGVMGIADFQCRQLLGARYHRLAPTFPAGTTVPLDDVKRLPYLAQFAEDLHLAATTTWIQQNWL